MPARSRRRSRSVRMFGAMPGSASPSSPKRRGPSSSASTTSRLQRSPTRSSAASSGGRRVDRRRGRVGHRQPMVRRSGLASAGESVVTCKSQVTTLHHDHEEPHHERHRRARHGHRRRRRPASARPSSASAATAAASGVVIADGQVLTNAHNLRGDEVTVTFADGRSTRGDGRGVDGDGDLAVIAVDTAGATPLAWARWRRLRARRTPCSARRRRTAAASRVTVGFVSAVARAFRGPGGRRIAGSVEHTAPLAPGSSGGALVDAEGRLVGLNTNRIGEGFYLALPADAALRARVDALGRGESPERPRLGVAIAPNHVARRLRRSVGLPERDGVLVRGVEDGSAGGGGRHRGRRPHRVGRWSARSRDGDDLFDALGALELPFELGRGPRRGERTRDGRRTAGARPATPGPRDAGRSP